MSIQGGWKTAYVVGRFLYSGPPRHDQIFKIQYRAVNGQVDSFVSMPGTMAAKVDGGNGTLQIKFPRNYPYANEPGADSEGSGPLLFVDGMEMQGPEKQVTDCFFIFSIPFSGRSDIEMAWPYLLTQSPYRGDAVPESCVTQTIVKDVPVKKRRLDFSPPPVQSGRCCRRHCLPTEHETNSRLKRKPYCAKEPTIKVLDGRWNSQK